MYQSVVNVEHYRFDPVILSEIQILN